ncbi:ribonuclease H-like domain-containing protein [Fimbriimonas ginsengisoli]|uniref:YprB ribonuclease H-like domain-containing protein n=1 Tax=Fimbriimonas ginsengisoli Gsoil 348 TaxID=661478 RepID=A0A068NV38_FIMGI|nr:ribonuclease H-like domain-containing protein [Fimbriimonas ginsengisoli]AIE87316.1 hypothetical protein OP10G_3948 [Fimbriimonas ginsengisoli Gsoil 348]
MLERTFLHIPGVGATTERSLWQQGCENWDHLLADADRFTYGAVERDVMYEVIRRSRSALSEGRAAFFRYGLGMRESWRAFPEFRHRCVYLDIETDGGQTGASITTIGLYDGSEYTCLVKGKDLDRFPEIISRYGYIVTFFGAGFDIPMIQKRFKGLMLDQLHLDLCPTLRRLGYRGGLKKIERQLGIARGADTDGLDGLDAIRLWRRYTTLGDDGALDTLVAYNREDVVNMERLAEIAYDGLRTQTLLA